MAFLNERNMAIYDKRINEKKTYRALAKEYGLSASRIQAICFKMKRIRERQIQALDNIVKNISENVEEERTLNWDNFTKKYNDIPQNILIRIFNAIYRNFFSRDLSIAAMPIEKRDYIILEKIKSITPAECEEVRNLGYKSISAIIKIQKRELGIPEVSDESTIKHGPSVYNILSDRYKDIYSDQTIRMAINSIYREYCPVDDFKKNIYDLEWFMNTIRSFSFIDMYSLRGCGVKSALFLQDVIEKEKSSNETPIS